MEYSKQLDPNEKLIDVLIKQNSKLKKLLRIVAFPRRGTKEESMDIFDAAKLIRRNFTLEELKDSKD